MRFQKVLHEKKAIGNDPGNDALPGMQPLVSGKQQQEGQGHRFRKGGVIRQKYSRFLQWPEVSVVEALQGPVRASRAHEHTGQSR